MISPSESRTPERRASAPTRPFLWCLTAAALFGASAPAARVLLRDLGPFTLAGLLYLGAAGGVLPLVGSTKSAGLLRLTGKPRSLTRLAGAIVSGGLIAPVLMLASLQRAPAASVALWLSLEAVFTSILAWLLFREHLHARGWIAAGSIFAGGALLASPDQAGSITAGVLAGLACLFWGLDNNLTALIDELTPAQCVLAKGTFAGAVNLVIGLRLEQGRGGAGIAAVVGAALLVGAASYGLSLALFIAGSQQLGAARAQMVFATSPLWGAAFCWTLLREPASMRQIAAGGIILAALWLLRMERHEHHHAHEPIRHLHWHRHDDGHHAHEHAADPIPAGSGHSHEHVHDAVTHTHPHQPDLHHRHSH